MPRSPFGWDYPPGVTGNEPEIVGDSINKCCIHCPTGSSRDNHSIPCEICFPSQICIRCKQKCHSDDVYDTKEGTVCLSCGEEEDRKREHAEAVVEASRRFRNG